MRVYLDNAATTPLDPEVLAEMLPHMQNTFGNPSSIHAYGREARMAIERVRKSVAGILNTSPSEIFFTSGATEADNLVLHSAISTLKIKHIITSPIEHDAVIHSINHLVKKEDIQVHYLTLDKQGEINLEELETLLSQFSPALVSLMHANNEIGNINDLHAIGKLCHQYGSFFHSDTVQTMGYLPIDLHELPVDFIVGAAHKFNGPKGIGFVYINGKNQIDPFIFGGSQERNMRGGTENLYGIVGLGKALELAVIHRESTMTHISHLKSVAIQMIREAIPHAIFNGAINTGRHFAKILSVTLPDTNSDDMILFSMDIQGVAISGGSACSSGTAVGSHVLQALYGDLDYTTVRFSFGKQNTEEEVRYAVQKLIEVYQFCKE